MTFKDDLTYIPSGIRCHREVEMWHSTYEHYVATVINTSARKIDGLERQTETIAQILDACVNKIDELERRIEKIDELERRIEKIEEKEE